MNTSNIYHKAEIFLQRGRRLFFHSWQDLEEPHHLLEIAAHHLQCISLSSVKPYTYFLEHSRELPNQRHHTPKDP